MKYTGNYQLKKPDGTDIVNIEDFNDNADKIDAELKNLNNKKVDKVAGKQLSTEDYTKAEKTKLAGITEGANKYVHPTGDGNLHVPATGTTNSGKVLKAGTTAGSASWSALNKNDVGLANLDNTSDANKPISTATQKALDDKANKSDLTDHLADNIAHNRYGTATGTNALVITLSPAPKALVAGFSLRFKNTTANSAAVTLNVNGLGAKTVKKQNGNALTSGNLKAGIIYTAVYDGTSFILQGEGGSGNAQPEDVLAGKTFTNENGEFTGTLAFVLKAGDTTLYEKMDITTPSGMSSTIPIKARGVRIAGAGGSVRVTFGLSSENGADVTEVYGQIYVNGNPKGIVRSTKKIVTTQFVEDFNIKSGDIIELYYWSSVNGSSARPFSRLFSVKYNFPITVTPI